MIQFLTSWNGYEFGAIASLGGAEAGLIAARIARNWTPGIEAFTDRVAKLRYDAAGTLVGVVSADPVTGVESIANLGGSAAGLVGMNGTDITASRALATADFDGSVRHINSGSVVAITVPTVAAMSLPATPGQLRVALFYVEGAGIPTFAGATSGTTINGVAGPTTVLPGSFGGVGGEAPARGRHYVLTQADVGADSWTLE